MNFPSKFLAILHAKIARHAKIPPLRFEKGTCSRKSEVHEEKKYLFPKDTPEKCYTNNVPKFHWVHKIAFVVKVVPEI